MDDLKYYKDISVIYHHFYNRW